MIESSNQYYWNLLCNRNFAFTTAFTLDDKKLTSLWNVETAISYIEYISALYI